MAPGPRRLRSASSVTKGMRSTRTFKCGTALPRPSPAVEDVNGSLDVTGYGRLD